MPCTSRSPRAVCLLALALPLSAQATDYRVYVLSGQSNMVGHGDVPDLPSELQSPQGSIPYYFETSGGNGSSAQLTTLRPGLESGRPTWFGPEITFGSTLSASLSPGQGVAIIKFAKGATSLGADWFPGGDATTTGDGPLYQTLQTVVADGLAAFRTASPADTFTLSGFLWQQGERDANLHSSTNYATNYATNLTAFIGDLRSTLGVPELPFFIGRISANQGGMNGAGKNLVRSAQASVASSVAGAYLIDLDGAAYSVHADDLIHFDGPGQIAIGEAYAAAALAAIPEPAAAVALAGLAALGLAASRRRARA